MSHLPTTQLDRYGFAVTAVPTTPASEAAAARVRSCDRLGLDPWPTPDEAALEAVCRDFARQFPTANVLRAIELAEAGELRWGQIAGLFERSLGEALEA